MTISDIILAWMSDFNLVAPCKWGSPCTFAAIRRCISGERPHLLWRRQESPCFKSSNGLKYNEIAQRELIKSYSEFLTSYSWFTNVNLNILTIEHWNLWIVGEFVLFSSIDSGANGYGVPFWDTRACWQGSRLHGCARSKSSKHTCWHVTSLTPSSQTPRPLARIKRMTSKLLK